MTVIKKKAELPKERVYTDVAITGAQGADFQGNINRLTEQITDVGAPGTVRTDRGHTHDSISGRGIYRTVDGHFYTTESTGPPLIIVCATTDPGESFGGGNATYYESDGGTGYKMGVAYVSPGVDSIKVEFSAGHNDPGVNVDIRIKNITDNEYSTGWTALTATTPVWYTSDPIPVDQGTTGACRRIELDIYVRVDAGSDDVYLFSAFPFEYEDQD